MVWFYGIFFWLNAWAADRAFRRRDIGWGIACVLACVACGVLWWMEVV